MFVPYFLSPRFSIESLNGSRSFSLSLPSILNAGQFLGRLFFSWLSDFKLGQAGPELYMLAAEVLLGLLGLCWIGVHNTAGFIPWLVIYGIVSGLPLNLPALVLPHICPNMAVYGTRLGMLYAAAGVGFLISTPIATALTSSSKAFLGSQIWTGSTSLAAASLFVFVAMTARRRRMLYELGKRRRYSVSTPNRQKTGGPKDTV